MKKEKPQLTDRITIPPAALEAAAKDHYEVWRDYNGIRSQTFPWEDIGLVEQEIHRETARAACLAMLSAWPNSVTNEPGDCGGC